jgi:outer membrane protein assembly factor BamB
VNLGQISSVPILDPTNYRLLITSTSLLVGSTVWALDAHDAPTTRLLWSRNIGDSDSSITFTSAARTSILVGTNTGLVYMLDPSTGITCWGSSSDGCGVATGLEEAFCTGTNSRASILCIGGSAIQKGIIALNGSYAGKFLFSTADGSVRLLNSTGVQQWRTVISGASAPLPVVSVGSGYVYVGGSDGAVHELALATGTQTSTRTVGVGSSAGSVVVGDPGYDGAANVLYVNTAQGNQYAFSVPF